MTNLTKPCFTLSLLLLVFFLHQQVAAQELAQVKLVSWTQMRQTQPQTSLKTVIEQIEKHYQVHLNYQNELLKGKKIWNVSNFQNRSIDEVFQQVLNPLGITAQKLKGNYYVLVESHENEAKQMQPMNLTQEISQEEKKTPFVPVKSLQSDEFKTLAPFSYPQRQPIGITGSVTSDDREPLIGVNIQVKGTSLGTVTDFDGNFNLNVPDDATTLVVSYTGYLTTEIEIGGRTRLDIVMQPDVALLDEVVVVGYGTQRKKDLTGSITTVNSSEYENQPLNRVDQILQGRTAGVNVTNASGAPGGAVNIRIRGANSINGNNDPLYVVDGFVGADFRDVNPADIESIQILKDASATAIYGSRGANGVVLITTRSGTSGEPKLSFTARYLTSEVLNTWDLLDAATFAEVVNERARAIGTPERFTTAEINDFKQNGGTDWQDELFRTATGQEFQVDYSGGTDAITYFVSGNFLGQEGVVINSDYQRYSLRTNLKANLSPKMSANLKMNFVRRENNNTEGGGNTNSAIAGASAWAPTTPVRDENGELTQRDPISSIKANPVELSLNDNISEENTWNANGGFRYEILEGFSVDVGFGVSYANSQFKSFSADLANNQPRASRRSLENIFLQNTNSVNYRRLFGRHSFDLTGAIEHQRLQSDEFLTNAIGLQFPDLSYNNLTLTSAINSSARKEAQTIRSYIGRINYAFDDKYLITASIRSDGSSKFKGDNQYGVFPSLALGWKISEEAFMQGSMFDDLKLRASYGKTGSQAIPVFGTVTTFITADGTSGASFQNGTLNSGITIGNPGNTSLRWETTEQFNVGFDAVFLNNRLGVTADYFEKNTEDLLIQDPLPFYSGGGNIIRNIGEMKNTGFEFSISASVFQSKNFSWSSNLNASFLTNEVINIGNRENIFVSAGAGAGLTNFPEGIIIPGRSISNFWGLNFLGIWQLDEAEEAAKYGSVPGDSRFQDLNNDDAIDGDDYQIIGTGLPDQLLGWNNTFRYKNFTLNVFFQGMMGFDKWNFAYAQAIMTNADAREVTHADILDRWSPSNTDSKIPAFSSTDLVELQSSRFLEPGDFIRLKNLSLTYNFPKEWLKGVNGSVMISGNNILTFTKYSGLDPETYSNRTNSDSRVADSRAADAGSYPNAKIWFFGLNFIF